MSDSGVCVRCIKVGPFEPCCSSHDAPLCHRCYRLTHFVEVCGCQKCEQEGLPRIYPERPATRSGWFAAQPHIVGDLHRHEEVYTWDGTVQESRALAISHGFGAFDSDDFNVGRVEADRLVWFGWMDEAHPAEDYPEVAQALGLKV